MGPQTTGVRSGILLLVIGVWVIMRTTHRDGTPTAAFPHGRTLIDHILGSSSSNSTSTGALPAPQALPGVPAVPAATGAGTPPAIANPNPFAPLLGPLSTPKTPSAQVNPGVPLVRVNGSSPNVTVSP
jgi:hypothetical protein